MTTPHTKEPWKQHAQIPRVLCTHALPDESLLARDAEGYFIVYKVEDAARIVACVNALAGLNPAAVKDVVEALERLLNVPEPMTAIEHFDYSANAERLASAALAKLKGGAK